MGMDARIRHIFSTEEMLPAAGQGALGIEIRSERQDIAEALSVLVDVPTWMRVAAERAVSRTLGGSCSVPLAAYAEWQADGQLALRAAWGDVQAAEPLLRSSEAAAVQDLAAAEALGVRVAQALLDQGAKVHDT
jgi:hydroxymethylbilane synthase